MDIRLTAISESTKDISRNLVLIQGETHNPEHFEAAEQALEAINTFESVEMHAVRLAVEGK